MSSDLRELQWLSTVDSFAGPSLIGSRDVRQPQTRRWEVPRGAFFRYFVQKEADFNESSNAKLKDCKSFNNPHIKRRNNSRTLLFTFFCSLRSVPVVSVSKCTSFPRLPGFSCHASTLAKPPVLQIELDIATTKSKNKKLEAQPKFYLLYWWPVVISVVTLADWMFFYPRQKRRTGR